MMIFCVKELAVVIHLFFARPCVILYFKEAMKLKAPKICERQTNKSDLEY